MRTFTEAPRLTAFTRRHLGAEPVEVTRLRGGTKKGAYRLTLPDGRTVVLYLWSPAENHWPAPAGGAPVLFGEASGPELFRSAHAALSGAGVRTVEILAFDASRTLLDGEAALVEDVAGGTLEALIARDPAAAEPVLDRLADSLRRMHATRSPAFGRVSAPFTAAPTAVGAITAAAHRDLAEAAARRPELRPVRDALAARLDELARAVPPRGGYTLVHGELGPDHVLIADGGEPVIIDIEGLMFLDAEWEHAFLEIRFGDRADRLRVPGLDPARLALYRTAHELSLVAGPLRLLDGDFPDREFMLGIVRHHVGKLVGGIP
ncbi:phosphotransferase family protein [Catenuloplanes atrovinosus]|uniref:Aminoglycoside phosphotransferase domain-containing protein n=1 Tax=Catenuloplanes atrovinosus TaxID=137266 RepID=A0AAE3YM79_9ACTN|nr:phosphotransferase [Catenuloplanes atrovinosus]MDR7274764.1 hypothetical protein [Catenuloplanes atrovinosus]